MVRQDAPAPLMARWRDFALLGLGLLLCLAGCGGPVPEEPAAASRAASPGATVAPPAVPAGVPEGGGRPRATGETGPASAGGMEAAASESSAPPQDQARSPVWPGALAEAQAQRDAWSQWYEAARNSLVVSDRLQALEQWAQRPGDPLDPVTYGLVDEDDTVRERAQALYEQHLAWEATQGAGDTTSSPLHGEEEGAGSQPRTEN